MATIWSKVGLVVNSTACSSPPSFPNRTFESIVVSFFIFALLFVLVVLVVPVLVLVLVLDYLRCSVLRSARITPCVYMMHGGFVCTVHGLTKAPGSDLSGNVNNVWMFHSPLPQPSVNLSFFFPSVRLPSLFRHIFPFPFPFP